MTDTKHLLEEENIFKMLLHLSIPAMIAGLIESLYNTVDSIFVGKFVGTEALGALAVINIFQMIYIGLGVLFNVGTSSIVSRSLGAQNKERALHVLKHGFWGCFIIANILSFTVLINLENFLKIIGANQDILPYAREYGKVILWTGFILPVNNMLLGSLRAKGQIIIATKLNILGALINIALDALFIVVFQWGVAGAAYATAIGQGVMFILTLRKVKQMYHTNLLLHSSNEINFKTLNEIVSLGLPTGLRLILFVATFSVMNNALGVYGTTPISAMGVFQRIINLMMMIVISLTFGAQPLIGFNYGANKYHRVKRIIFTELKISFIICLINTLILLLAPYSLYAIFTHSVDIIKICQEISRYNGITFIFWGFFICIAETLQAMGHAKEGFILSISFPISIIILIFTLPHFVGMKGVWLSYMISYLVMGIFSLFILFKELKALHKKEQQLKDAF